MPLNTIADTPPPDDARDHLGRIWWGGPMGDSSNDLGWCLSATPHILDTHWAPHDAIPKPFSPDYGLDDHHGLLTPLQRNSSLK